MDNSNQTQVGHANDWLSDHGQKSFGELKSLAEAGTPESLERLYQLGEDNSITFDDTTDPIDLAEKIYSAMESDPNMGVE